MALVLQMEFTSGHLSRTGEELRWDGMGAKKGNEGSGGTEGSGGSDKPRQKLC